MSVKYERVQRRLARACAVLVGDVAGLVWSQEFQQIGSLRVGSFVGLACPVCETWYEYGHKPDCRHTRAKAALARQEATKALYLAFVRFCREHQETDSGRVAGRDFAY